MNLPDSFKERMKGVLGDEYDAFIASFDDPPVKGIRLNTAKTDPSCRSSIVSCLTGEVRPVPWTSCGYYSSSENSGRDPYYHAGVYYPQDPSAMLPAEIICAKPGELILDLCAAPGGKACRIGEDLKGVGLLVANEINSERSKALNRNIERTGIINCVILNESPQSIAMRLPGFFDKILIDAPCSGEGMFRRDPRAVKSWSDYGPEQVSHLQYEIITEAAKALRPGGEIVYSTCTFAQIEDELLINRFLEDHPGFVIVPHKDIEGVTHSTKGFMRIWPHKAEGDGHFCVHLRDTAPAAEFGYDLAVRPDKGSITTKIVNKVREYMSDILTPDSLGTFMETLEEKLMIQGSGVYVTPVAMSLFDRMKIVKSGFFVGEIKTTKTERFFCPSNSFPLTLNKDMIREDSSLDLSHSDPDLIRYLKGETITIDNANYPMLKRSGVIVIMVDGFPLGLGKNNNGTVKNLYPKAWRLL